MSDSRELRRMRMEMLRTRAALERAEVVSAVDGLREQAVRMRTATTTLKGLGRLVGALSGRRGNARTDWARPFGRGRGGAGGGLLSTVIDQLMRRPWLAALGLKALRSAKRHPAIAAAAVAGVAVATVVAKRRRDPAGDIFSAPMG